MIRDYAFLGKVKKEREIFLLPLRSDTLRAQRKREELEDALTEIEEGLRVLSKPVVIVQEQGSDHPSSEIPEKVSEPKKPQTAKAKAKPAWNKGAVDRNKIPQPKSTPVKTGLNQAKTAQTREFINPKDIYRRK